LIFFVFFFKPKDEKPSRREIEVQTSFIDISTQGNFTTSATLSSKEPSKQSDNVLDDIPTKEFPKLLQVVPLHTDIDTCGRLSETPSEPDSNPSHDPYDANSELKLDLQSSGESLGSHLDSESARSVNLVKRVENDKQAVGDTIQTRTSKVEKGKHNRKGECSDSEDETRSVASTASKKSRHSDESNAKVRNGGKSKRSDERLEYVKSDRSENIQSERSDSSRRSKLSTPRTEMFVPQGEENGGQGHRSDRSERSRTSDRSQSSEQRSSRTEIFVPQGNTNCQGHQSDRSERSKASERSHGSGQGQRSSRSEKSNKSTTRQKSHEDIMVSFFSMT